MPDHKELALEALAAILHGVSEHMIIAGMLLPELLPGQPELSDALRAADLLVQGCADAVDGELSQRPRQDEEEEGDGPAVILRLHEEE